MAFNQKIAEMECSKSRIVDRPFSMYLHVVAFYIFLVISVIPVYHLAWNEQELLFRQRVEEGKNRKWPKVMYARSKSGLKASLSLIYWRHTTIMSKMSIFFTFRWLVFIGCASLSFATHSDKTRTQRTNEKMNEKTTHEIFDQMITQNRLPNDNKNAHTPKYHLLNDFQFCFFRFFLLDGQNSSRSNNKRHQIDRSDTCAFAHLPNTLAMAGSNMPFY